MSNNKNSMMIGNQTNANSIINTMEIDKPMMNGSEPPDPDRLNIQDVIFAHPCFSIPELQGIKENNDLKTVEDVLTALYNDKKVCLQVISRMMRVINQRGPTTMKRGHAQQPATKSYKAVAATGVAPHPAATRGEKKPNQYNSMVAKSKIPKSTWKQVTLTNEDMNMFAQGELSVGRLHYEPMQHRYLYFRFKKTNKVSIRLTKTFLINLKIDLKHVSWVEHVDINKEPYLEMIVRNCIVDETIQKVSQYLSYEPRLCPEKIFEGYSCSEVVPQPTKDFLRRVQVTVEKLKILSFRPQCRKFLEKIHALASNVSLETSQEPNKEQLVAKATTQVALSKAATSDAVPTAIPNVAEPPTKKSATAKSTTGKGKVSKIKPTTTKKSTTKKVTKEAAPSKETGLDDDSEQYVNDYLCGKDPVNEMAAAMYRALEARGYKFGSESLI